MMALSEVLSLVVAIAKAFGLVSDEVVAYAKQIRPALRTDPLPDAAGDMYAARARAQLREAREVAARLWASGDIRGSAYQEILRALDGGEPT